MSYISISGSQLPTPLLQILQADNVQVGTQPSYELCKQLYEFHPLAGKIIEKPIQMALNKPRKIAVPTEAEEMIVKAFKDEWSALGATNHIRDTMYLSRIYGAGAIVYGAKGVPTDQPMDLWKLSEYRELYFNQLDPLNLAGSIVGNQNPNAPDFQKPLQYLTAAGQPYHPSRSNVIFCGTPVYLSFQSSAYSFLGRSLFMRALFPLKSFIQTMTADDLVSLKCGVIVAKIQQPGSVINNLMSKAAGLKRQLLQEAQTGNVLSIQPDESIESIDLNNVDKSLAAARDNIISNIAAATDVPAMVLRDEAFANGFGEGKEDSKKIAQFVDGIRCDMQPLFDFFDRLVQHRAWNEQFFDAVKTKFPEAYGKMTYREFFYHMQGKFQAIWPAFIEEPESDRIKIDQEKMHGNIEMLRTLLPVMDKDNRAKLIKWVEDNVNANNALYQNKLTLDFDKLREYDAPTAPLPDAKLPAAGHNY